MGLLLLSGNADQMYIYTFCFKLKGVPLPPLNKKESSSVGTDLPIVVEVSIYIYIVCVPSDFLLVTK